MEPYWQLLSPRLNCLGIDPRRVEAHPALHGLREGDSVVLREREPRLFMEALFAALLRGCNVWLASPDWQTSRMRGVAALSRPARVLGDHALPEPPEDAPPPPDVRSLAGGQPAVCIPTGGTSGRLRFALHTWDSLAAAGTGFLEFFGQQRHRTLCTLPLYHVGGLMQAVRVLLSGGELALGMAHDPRMGLPRDFDPRGRFISLVPSQLKRLLDAGTAAWLRRFETILIGGAAVDASLLARARVEGLPLAPSYGMTETAAVICALRPQEFLDGVTGSGRPLPHASLLVEPLNGAPASVATPGRVLVRARSLCRALVPGGHIDLRAGLQTNDLGYFDERGVLHITGRSDRVVVSGGLKLDPGEIEEAIMDSGLVREVTVISRPDPQWGQVAVACYVPSGSALPEESLRDAVRSRLSPMHVPKAWFPFTRLPRTAMGKLDRETLEKEISRPGS